MIRKSTDPLFFNALHFQNLQKNQIGFCIWSQLLKKFLMEILNGKQFLCSASLNNGILTHKLFTLKKDTSSTSWYIDSYSVGKKLSQTSFIRNNLTLWRMMGDGRKMSTTSFFPVTSPEAWTSSPKTWIFVLTL